MIIISWLTNQTMKGVSPTMNYKVYLQELSRSMVVLAGLTGLAFGLAELL